MELSKVVGNSTVREQLEQVFKTTKKLPKELANEPEATLWGEYMLQLFWDLSKARIPVSLGMGAIHPPLTWTEIKNWMIVRKRQLTQLELDVIRQIEDVYLSFLNKPAKAGTLGNQKSKARRHGSHKTRR